LFLNVLFVTSVQSQDIQISVTDKAGKYVSPVVLILKDSSDTLKIKEYFVSENGKFNVILQEKYDNLIIEVNSFTYYSQKKIIKSPQTKNLYDFLFVLEKKPPIALEEILVKTNKLSYYKKEDTITYNVSSYVDGSERKIEEIIKKLPGIKVNEQSGEIKYNGKSVETITLDGDNLFGFNYSLGTKNINVDMVEQIQAIDNYSANHLLKEIEQSDKVSLNLILKKGKMDISGNFDCGSGLYDEKKSAFKVNSNILGISKVYKSFATLNFNNIGFNYSPFDYFGFKVNLEQQKEKNFFAEKLIYETRFPNLLDDRRANINKQFFGNYNSIFKIQKKLSIKTNLYYLQDKITTDQLLESQYQISNQNFTTTDNTVIIKKPQQYRGDLEIKYNTSKSSLLEYNIRIKKENIGATTQITQNQVDSLKSFLETRDFFIKQDFLWTKKLSDKKAMQVSFFHSYDRSPQTYIIFPSLFDENEENDTQTSEFKKTYIEGKVVLLGTKKRNKYCFTLGSNFNNSPFKSCLFNKEKTISQNDFFYTQKTIFNTGVYNINHKNWLISPSYSMRFLAQILNERINNNKQTTNNFIFEPKLKIKYKLNSFSFLTANIGINQESNTEQYLFLSQVMVDNRTTVDNIPSLDLHRSQYYNLLYYSNDLYNQFQLNTSIGYQKSTGNIYSKIDITDNATQIQYFFLPHDNTNWNVNLYVSKYIPFIKSTLKTTSNYSISNYKNIVNESELRKVQSRYLENKLFWKTAFDILVNFENTFAWRQSYSHNEDQQPFINNALQNSFKVILKTSNKWVFILSSDYYVPNVTQKKENYLFLDATFRHRPKGKKWEASFIMRNLTNEQNFEQIQTSDISTLIFRSNLLPMCFMLNFSWNF